MKKIFFIFMLLAIGYTLLVSPVFAQSSSGGITTGPNPEDGGTIFELPNPLKTKSIGELLDRILGFLLILSIPIATLMIIIGAFQILMAAGSVEKVANGKQTIIYSVIGLGIILLARVLVAVLKGILGVA